MKCVLISCFNAYDNRIKPIESLLNEQGYECEYITSDFHHYNKAKYTINRSNTIQIKVPEYKSNVSLKRLWSHFIFSKKVSQRIKKVNPDLIYALIPPNSLTWFLAKYKKKNDVKLIYDIYDLWPETFPSQKTKNILSLIFYFWRNLRDKNLSSADYIITECNLFQDILKDLIKGFKTKALYPTITGEIAESNFIFDNEKVHLCYLGSINNIIDIEKIVEIVKAINTIKSVVCHIIGDGENRDVLISRLKETGAHIEYYGKIYDSAEKQKIFDKCYCGLNIMKESVCVGLTLKSIDYFCAGLPILNNIKADTTDLVTLYNVGFNVTDSNISDIASVVGNMTESELRKMKESTQKMFDVEFALSAFNDKIKNILKDI